MASAPESEPESSSRHETESLLLADSDDVHWLDGLAAGLLVAAFWIAAGIGGGVAGLVTVGVWLGLGTPYALATGVVFVTALTSDGIAAISLVLVGGGLLALLIAPVRATNEPGAYVITVLFTAGAFGSLTWLLVDSQPLWLTVIALLGAGVTVTYGLYRYQLLQLGLLGDGDAESDESDAPETASETS